MHDGRIVTYGTGTAPTFAWLPGLSRSLASMRDSLRRPVLQLR
jgi:hypothetical protein